VQVILDIPDDSAEILSLSIQDLLVFIAKVASAEARFRTLTADDMIRLTSRRTVQNAVQELQEAVDLIKNPKRKVEVIDEQRL
jgi:hypothetical protein